MRNFLRSVFAATFIVVLAVPLPARAQSLVGEGAVYQLAASLWFANEDGTKMAYLAFASREVVTKFGRIPYLGPEPITGIGGVGRGACRERRRGLVCKIEFDAYALNPTTFYFDPMLDSARMTIVEDGHDIQWTGRGSGSNPEYGFGGSTNWASAWATFDRKAALGGKAYGEKLDVGSPPFSFLLQGADAFAVASKRLNLHFQDGRIRSEGSLPPGLAGQKSPSSQFTIVLLPSLPRPGWAEEIQSRARGSIGISTSRSRAMSIAR